jgi:protein O-GlcNAc transferase
VTIPQAFQIALRHHQSGRLANAEALYRQILAVQPNHADALHLLGVIAHQAGRHDLATEWIRQAIVLNPNNPAAHSNLGEAHYAAGRMEDAIASYRRALQLKFDYPEACNNLGNALRARGRTAEAIAAFRRALHLKPDVPEVHYNLGNALRDGGQLDEAVAAFRGALQLKPELAEVQNDLGSALMDRGQLNEALAAFRRALELKPDYPEAHNNLGNALRAGGQIDEAVAAFHRALELKPRYPDAHANLGVALAALGRLDEAIAAFRYALQIEPDFPEAHNNLGNVLKDLCQLDEAIAAFRRAFHFKPEFAGARSNLVYTLNFHPGYDARAIAEECARWQQQHAAPLRASIRPHGNTRNLARRLRIGYVSSNFYFQAECFFVIPLFEAHDHSLCEVHAYSDVLRPDFITERLEDSVDVWRDVRALSDEQLAGQIREDSIDVLVDLSMHMSRNRLPLFARRPAPVQVAWLAYPGSTGLHSIGYRLTDAHMEPPEEDSAWSAEEPVRLPDCWCCYGQIGESPEINELPALTADGVTFGSLNNFAKVHEGVLARWARVLEAVKGSRLVMLCPEGRTRERVLAFFGARGIGAERVKLLGVLSLWDYLRLYQRIDLGLDPFPYNGITTTCDALWMGVPVLTLPGTMPASRAGLSLLSSVGLGELAAYSEEDYVRMAVELAGNLPRLAELRATLRPRMLASPLMDAPRFARNIEAAYRSMWERWCNNQSPNM